MNSQSIIVPKISTLPVHEPRARAIVRWLVRKISSRRVSTCGAPATAWPTRSLMAPARWCCTPRRCHRRAGQWPGNRHQALHLHRPRLPRRSRVRRCRREIGEALFESLEEWMPGPPITSPARNAGMKTTSTALFLQECAFSNLGFIFNKWLERASNRALSTNLPIGSINL